jgi:hypothetical protein
MIANVRTVLSSTATRKKTESALAAGQEVVIQSTAKAAIDPALAKYLENFGREIEAGRGALSNIYIPQYTPPRSKAPALPKGVVTGALVGASVGIVIDQLRNTHPVGAILLDAACAVIGGVVGDAVTSGKFSVEGYFEITEQKVGIKITPVLEK